ncbi:MAG TPA: peptidyl-prolyl cis-trans isomerase [Thermoanaerobaculia bacterium]|nr:peptidyl-prolyl cis-trans isomerase [Thermoanaerobaculia bacterium]
MPRKPASLTLILALALAPALVSTARAEVLNRVVLRVNDQIATLYDYQQHREELVRDILHREQDSGERQRLLGQAGELAYADLFRELLLQSRADQLAVEVTDAQVEATIAQIKQNNNLKTDDDFKAALAQSGLTEAQLRAQIRKQLRVQEVRGREVQGRVKVDEEDLRRYYRKNLEQFRQPEQLQLREAVVLDDGGLPAADRQRAAAEIRAKVQGGASLADAVADSAKKGTTSNAIDLGWVSPGDLDKNLEAAVWKLPKGAVSEPVQARGGLHLVQVLDRRESRVPPFSEVQQAIQAREQERVFRQESAKYMVELEKKSLIVANPPAEAANYRRQLAADTDLSDQGGSLNVPSGNPAAAPAPAPGVATGATPSTSTSIEPTAPGSLPTPKPTDTAPPPVGAPPVTPPPATNPPPPSTPPPGI